MRSVALHVLNESTTFGLHPADVFYHAFVTIDLIRSSEPNERAHYCACELWDDMYFEFMEVDDNKDDVARAVALVMIYVSDLLASSDSPHAVTPAGILTRQVDRHVVGVGDKLEQLFSRQLDHYQDELKVFMQDYLSSDRMISEEIERLIDEAHASAASGEVKTIVEDSGIRFKGNLTALMYVLEAMHKAGWFTDAEGKSIRSKDKVIRSIMKHAFGIEDPHLSQLRNAAKNRNYKQPSKYFDQLKEYIENTK